MQQLGFTAVELLVTLFIAAAFLISGYQLYGLIIRDGGETRAQSHASNLVYDYMQRYKPNITNPCTAPVPIVDHPSVANLSNVTVTVNITCPYGTTSPVSKILVILQYGDPQQAISDAIYATQ
jgi:prepilin-type N-terminal cleavage/methylation domain-containing protein